jgi:outer membrane protein
MKKLIVLILLISCLAAQSISAQTKVGYINAAAILVEMPEVKQADSNLKVLSEQLQKKDEQMVATLQGKYQELQKKEKSGEIAPKELEMQSKKLEADRDSVVKFEQEIQAQLSEKKQTMYAPILEKVNKAIDDVAKENGFSYIFDASSGVILYAEENKDVSALVRTKLGLASTATTVAPKSFPKK